jgi:glycosyltransferase involved in cell wall biosynthesis
VDEREDGAPAIAFHAPLKAPGHGVPSGDREMARLMLRALDRAGFAPSLASPFRSFDAAGDPAFQAACQSAAQREIERLVAAFRVLPSAARPRLWFTYHAYYKAPDLIGPAVADALGIPYVVAEGSHAAKRANGPWAAWHAACERALRRADLHLLLNPADRAGLETLAPRGIAELPPFLDPADWPAPQISRGEGGAVQLLAVAMMREGDKLASYRLLAAALERIDGDWRLDIVGDGAARGEVERLFAPLGARVRFHGLVTERATLAALYAGADLLVWPAINEAFGMVFLEAALQGCPALAGAAGGVSGVVEAGRGGLLVPPGDAPAFAAALERLVGDPALCRRLGTGARDALCERHTIDAAAARLRAALLPLLQTGEVGP